MNVPSTNYKRILLKLSGEALMGKREFGIDDAILKRVARCYGLTLIPLASGR